MHTKTALQIGISYSKEEIGVLCQKSRLIMGADKFSFWGKVAGLHKVAL